MLLVRLKFMRKDNAHMVIILLKMPQDWRKVNISRMLARKKGLKKIGNRLVLEVSDDTLDDLLNTLKARECDVKVAFEREPKERRILKQLLKLCEDIRNGTKRPSSAKKVVKLIYAREKEFPDSIADILHALIEFEEQPSIVALNQVISEIREALQASS
jgi:hypothetical protein